MIRPLQDRVLVQRVDAEDMTASGIIIPDTAKESLQKVKWSQLGLANALTMVPFKRWESNKVIKFYSVSMAAPR